MNSTLKISLKSTNNIIMENFKHFSYPDEENDLPIIVEVLDNFYLYDDQPLTFVGENDVICLDSSSIEYIKVSS